MWESKPSVLWMASLLATWFGQYEKASRTVQGGQEDKRSSFVVFALVPDSRSFLEFLLWLPSMINCDRDVSVGQIELSLRELVLITVFYHRSWLGRQTVSTRLSVLYFAYSHTSFTSPPPSYLLPQCCFWSVTWWTRMCGASTCLLNWHQWTATQSSEALFSRYRPSGRTRCRLSCCNAMGSI